MLEKAEKIQSVSLGAGMLELVDRGLSASVSNLLAEIVKVLKRILSISVFYLCAPE